MIADRRCRQAPPPRSEAGVATTATAAVMGFVLLVAAAIVQAGMVVAAKHRVQAAADLAALAGSAAALRGEDGCAVVHAVVRRNQSSVASCRTDLAVVTVHASGTAKTLWGLRWRVESAARAAPTFYVIAPS